MQNNTAGGTQGGNTNQGGQNNPQGAKQPGLSWTQPAQGNRPAAPASTPSSSTANMQKPSQPSAAMKKEDAEENTGGKGAWAFAAGVVVVALVALGWYLIAHNSGSPETASTSGAGATTSQTAGMTGTGEEIGTATSGGSGVSATGPASQTGTGTSSSAPTLTGGSFGSSLIIPSPQDAGESVAITSISVSQPTWVVVYDSRDGKPGNALGAALFFSTSRSGVVDLLRNTVAGQTYFIGESLDTNNNHQFELHTDPQVTDQSGNVVWTTFVAQ